MRIETLYLLKLCPLFTFFIISCAQRPNADLDLVGKTPIALSQSTSLVFQKYMRSNKSKAFAIDVSGNGSYFVTCNNPPCAYKYGSAAQEAVKQCNHRNIGGCKLFALGKDLVWEGTIDWPKWKAGEQSLVVNYVPHVEKSVVRSIRGKAELNGDGSAADLAVYFEGSWCLGKANFGAENWYMACKSGVNYRGELQKLGPDRYEGSSDHGGLKINIDIPPPGTIPPPGQM